MQKRLFYPLAVLATLIVAFVMWQSMTQPGVGELKGDFKEVAFYRNENNTGPITRIYAVIVNDTLWGEMKKFGAYMPHTKYGNTKVYFFYQDQPTPDNVFPGSENFEKEFNKYCLGVYEKNAMGQESFVPYPYKNTR